MSKETKYERKPEKRVIPKSSAVALLDEGIANIVGNLYKMKGTLGCLASELKDYYSKSQTKEKKT